jgi:DNA polymerase-1
MSSKIIIDGDIFLYQCAFASETEVCWDAGKNFYTLYGELGPAQRAFSEQVDKVVSTVGVDDFIICFSGKDIFRKKLDPEYKANRSGKRKPVVLVPLREYIMEKYRSMAVPHLEADDLLGILAQEDDIMVTSDKDLQTVPGLHYDPRSEAKKGESGVFQIKPHEAIYHHLIQTLTGDSTDNIKGCPKVGPVTARKKLRAAPPSDMWSQVVGIFEESGMNEEYAITQARLTYILRGDDYDFRTGNINHWTPETYNEYDRTV